jgi:dihydrofolate reductase
LNALPKYVVSRTLEEPLAWQNSKLLKGDLARAVAALKHEEGKDLLAIGTPMLVQTLLADDLVDELRLMIDPVILGGGKRFFRDEGTCRRFALVAGETTSTGAILATYARTSGMSK